MFQDIVGQEHAKRAAEVAIAGWHSIAFIGSHESQAQDLANTTRGMATRIYQGSSPTVYALAPCPCGFYGDPVVVCTCSIEQITNYRLETWPEKTAEITLRLAALSPEKTIAWAQNAFRDGEEDRVIESRILAALNRIENTGDLEPDGSVWALLRQATKVLHLTPSQVRQCLNIGNTIGHLAAAEVMESPHIAEAIQYRQKRE